VRPLLVRTTVVVVILDELPQFIWSNEMFNYIHTRLIAIFIKYTILLTQFFQKENTTQLL
jgi:hypothetical protein